MVSPTTCFVTRLCSGIIAFVRTIIYNFYQLGYSQAVSPHFCQTEGLYCHTDRVEWPSQGDPLVIFVFCFVSQCFPSPPLPHPHSYFQGIGICAYCTENYYVLQLYNIKPGQIYIPYFLWVLFLTHNVSLVKVKFVKFRLNLSLCSKCPEVIRSSSPPFQFLLYLYTFLTLFEPFFTVSCAR